MFKLEELVALSGYLSIYPSIKINDNLIPAPRLTKLQYLHPEI